MLALSLAVFTGAASMRCLDAVLPSLAGDFGRSVGSVGGAASAYALSYSVFQLVHGPLGDRIGAYRVVVFATCFSALAAGACALATSLATLMTLRFVAGAIAAAIGPLTLAWVSRSASLENRPVALARMTAAAILGTAAGQVGGGVIGGIVGWPFIFLALAVLFAGSGVALASLAHSCPGLMETTDRGAAVVVPVAPILSLLRRRSVRGVLAAVGVEGFGIYLSLTYVGALLRDRLSIGPSQAGLIVSLYGAGGVTFVVLAPRLLRMFSTRLRAFGAGLLLGAGFAALGLSSSEAAAAGSLFVVGFGFLMMHNVLQLLATRMAPDALATSLSLFAAASSLSQALGGLGGGTVFDHAGPTFGCLSSAAVLIVLGVVVSAAVRPRSSCLPDGTGR